MLCFGRGFALRFGCTLGARRGIVSMPSVLVEMAATYSRYTKYIDVRALDEYQSIMHGSGVRLATRISSEACHVRRSGYHARSRSLWRPHKKHTPFASGQCQLCRGQLLAQRPLALGTRASLGAAEVIVAMNMRQPENGASPKPARDTH